MKRLALSAALLLASAAALPAQVDYAEAGRAYVQTFDHPAAAETGEIAWQDNVTFPGWHALLYDGVAGRFSVPETILPTHGPGRLNTAFYLYRSTPVRSAGAAPIDAALGTQPTDQRTPGVGSGGIFYGVALVNRSGKTLQTLRLSYRVELWRLAVTASTQTTLTASVRVGGTGLTDGIWTLMPGGVYTTPIAGEGEGAQARSLDGNAPENVVRFTDLTLTDLDLAPGQTLWVRWFDVNNRFADHGIGLDDVSITLLP